MQRREQQRRTTSSGGGTSYSGGISGYSSIPRFEAPELPTTSASRSSTTNTAQSVRTPTFKGSGMKLGMKKTKQAELLDALGGEVLASTGSLSELSAPTTPAIPELPATTNNGRGSVPEVEAERCVQLGQFHFPWLNAIQHPYRCQRAIIFISSTRWWYSKYGAQG